MGRLRCHGLTWWHDLWGGSKRSMQHPSASGFSFLQAKSDGLEGTAPMLLCSGTSGLGTTRLLEESGAILEALKGDFERVARVIDPYAGCFEHPPVKIGCGWRRLSRGVSCIVIFLTRTVIFPFPRGFASQWSVADVKPCRRCHGVQLTFEAAHERDGVSYSDYGSDNPSCFKFDLLSMYL